MSIYNLFKKWHSTLVKKRDMDPDTIRKYRISKPPDPSSQTPNIKPTLSEKETNHMFKQKELVNMLIEFGIGKQRTTHGNTLLE